MISRSILTKNNFLITYLVFILTIGSTLYGDSYSHKIKKRSGSLRIALKVNTHNTDTNFLEIENFVIQVRGRHFKRTQKIGKDSLLWQDVPENRYQIKLLNSKSESEFSGTFVVKKGEQTKLEIQWVGNDHRIPSNPRVWYLKAVGGWGQGTRWDYGSWQKTFHADGKIEIYHHGIVFGRDNQNRFYSRFDWDNDLISDMEDRDDDNDGIYDINDRDDDNDGIEDSEDGHDTDNDNNGVINELEIRDQVLGNLQYPVIESYSVMNLDSRIKGFLSEPGDLLKIDFKVNEAGGKPIDKIRCELYSTGKRSFDFEPLDDGSIEDLKPEIVGRQISGDLTSGDGIYSMILPLDSQRFKALYPSMIACKAFNLIGKESQEILLFSNESNNRFQHVARSKIYDQINKVGIKFYKSKLENRPEEIRLTLELKKPMIVKVYFGQRSIFLEPVKKALKFTRYSDSFEIPQPGLFFLTVVDNDGGVFYFGEKVN
ncbi:MAG: hypothetical protein VX619_05165 [bacterium]|nr:hypothetical protein [bacterium]